MMLGQQPSEYTEYGVAPDAGYADYRLETGYNEFKRNGKPTRHAKHAGPNNKAVEQDMAAALEAERKDIALLMAKLYIYTDARAVVRAFIQAIR